MANCFGANRGKAIFSITASLQVAFSFTMGPCFLLIQSVTHGFSEFGRPDEIVLTNDSRRSINRIGRFCLILGNFLLRLGLMGR